jgi:hypothetical protein
VFWTNTPSPAGFRFQFSRKFRSNFVFCSWRRAAKHAKQITMTARREPLMDNDHGLFGPWWRRNGRTGEARNVSGLNFASIIEIKFGFLFRKASGHRWSRSCVDNGNKAQGDNLSELDYNTVSPRLARSSSRRWSIRAPLKSRVLDQIGKKVSRHFAQFDVFFLT